MMNSEFNRLLFYSPARAWSEGFPIGNGRLGAVVYGHPGNERIQLNEDSLWYGGPRDRHNPDARTHLPEIRRLLFEGKIKEAEKLAVLALSGLPESQRHYVPLGHILIQFSNPEGEIEAYSRELDMSTGIVTIQFKCKDTVYTREIFASFPDQAIVVRLTADQPGAISFTTRMERGNWRYAGHSGRVGEDAVFLAGNSGGEDGIDYAAVLKASSVGGSTKVIGEHIVVEQADTVTLYLTAATSFRVMPPLEDAAERMAVIANQSYKELFNRHVRDHGALFRSVSLAIGSDEPELDHMSLDKRIERLIEGEQDPRLIALYFQYGRYLLIASSRPGSLPANLQGIWNELFIPPWDSKFTININTQMNYWPAENCGLSECHEPLFDLLERLHKTGSTTAQVTYGCRGFMAHHNTDIWADTAPQDTYIPATYWPMGAAWLCLHLWERYLYTMDIAFLKRAYPVMRDAALFLLDFLVESPSGELVTSPSLSPENTYLLPNGEQGTLCAGPAMDTQITRELFMAVSESEQLLGIAGDGALASDIEIALGKLPKPKIGRHGQLQEWLEDYEEAEPGHRHISHLFALHPGSQITLHKEPELAEAARKSLERRLAHGGAQGGWSRAWAMNGLARLREAEKAMALMPKLLARNMLPNHPNNSPVYQIDGIFGGTAAIAEMLLQSHAGEIHLLPALPQLLHTGEVNGLRARGGYVVRIAWAERRLIAASIRSSVAGECVLRTPIPVKLVSCDETIGVEREEECVLRFTVMPNSEYELLPL